MLLDVIIPCLSLWYLANVALPFHSHYHLLVNAQMVTVVSEMVSQAHFSFLFFLYNITILL